MPIKWTIIVLGALLHAMASVQNETTAPVSTTTQSIITSGAVTISNSTGNIIPSPTSVSTTLSQTTLTVDLSEVNSTTQSNTFETTTQADSANHKLKPNTSSPGAIFSSTETSTLPSTSNSASTSNPATILTSNTPPGQDTSLSPTNSNKQLNNSDPATQPHTPVQDGQVATPSTTNPTTQLDISSTSVPLSPTKSYKQTTEDKETSTATQTESLTTPAENLKTTVLIATEAQTTTATITTVSTPDTVTSTSAPQNPIHVKKFDLSTISKGNVIHEACKVLGQHLTGNCSAKVDIQNKQLIATITIDADQLIPEKMYKQQEKKEDEAMIPDTLIAILASCGALVLILLIFAAYCTYHRRSYRKNQQHLTEELQTVENGYHDNPTLEVMEVQPEMQEKKLALNGEFNDSWIVPIDNLLKDNIPDEEDTHL